MGLVLLLAGLGVGGGIQNIAAGLKRIVTAQDLLITDYVALAGLGPALVNAGLVTLIAVALLYLSADPLNGSTLVTVSLMAGFSLFGKNIVNIWPILLGSWLYAKAKKEPFSKYVSTAMLATSLAPLVTFAALDGGHTRLWLGAVVGIAIGFLIPPLAAYTFRIQNGMNLYNTGFACGLLAMVMVSVMKAFGGEPEAASYWATGYNWPLGIAMAVVCVGLIAWALVFYGKEAVRGYRHLLHTTGRAPSDYLRTFGTGPVLLNMGVNGLLAMGYVLFTGGDLNGATLGGIFTVMGFSAYGKHARNIVPVMVGVLLGSLLNNVPWATPALQLAGLFGTTLAPFSGLFGWPFGVLAGFLHSSVVLYAGLPLEGFNLYNNGFSGGLVAMVLYPVLTALVRHRKPSFQDEEYFDTFEQDGPLPEEKLDAHKDDDKKMPH
jgi:hypothetical protein